MKNTITIVSLFISIIIFNSSAKAAANDENNYTGDRLSFPVKVNASYTNAGVVTNVCIPAKTALRGMPPTADGSLNVTAISNVSSDKIKQCDGTTDLPTDVQLKIDKAILDNTKPNRYGFCYGALIVPYKYHLSGSKDFNGNSTIGPYIGYRLDKASVGVAAEFIGFAGASSISATQTTNGQSTTQNLAGFSYGVGIIGVVKNTFQLGLVLGFDKVSNSSNYVDDNKPWIALSIGYSFAQ